MARIQFKIPGLVETKELTLYTEDFVDSNSTRLLDIRVHDTTLHHLFKAFRSLEQTFMFEIVGMDKHGKEYRQLRYDVCIYGVYKRVDPEEWFNEIKMIVQLAEYL